MISIVSINNCSCTFVYCKKTNIWISTARYREGIRKILEGYSISLLIFIALGAGTRSAGSIITNACCL